MPTRRVFLTSLLDVDKINWKQSFPDVARIDTTTGATTFTSQRGYGTGTHSQTTPELIKYEDSPQQQRHTVRHNQHRPGYAPNGTNTERKGTPSCIWNHQRGTGDGVQGFDRKIPGQINNRKQVHPRRLP